MRATSPCHWSLKQYISLILLTIYYNAFWSWLTPSTLNHGLHRISTGQNFTRVWEHSQHHSTKDGFILEMIVGSHSTFSRHAQQRRSPSMYTYLLKIGSATRKQPFYYTSFYFTCSWGRFNSWSSMAMHVRPNPGRFFHPIDNVWSMAQCYHPTWRATVNTNLNHILTNPSPEKEYSVSTCYVFPLRTNRYTKKPNHINPTVKQLLQTYYEIFDKPSTLPPLRFQDDRIPTLANSNLINVRLYWYPYYQKEIMTKLIMLEDKIIKSIQSPYSFPILLARKKNGTWHFCVDYMSLNVTTIKDQFSIPTVGELLDKF